MALSNAQRQRRFIERLKTKTLSAQDDRLTSDPWPEIRFYRVDPVRTSKEKKMLPAGWDLIEEEAESILIRLSSSAYGSGVEQRLRALRYLISVMERAGPQFLCATRRYLAYMEADLQDKEPRQRKKGKSLG